MVQGIQLKRNGAEQLLNKLCFKAGIQVRVGRTIAPEVFPWTFRPMRGRKGERDKGPLRWESDPKKPKYGQDSPAGIQSPKRVDQPDVVCCSPGLAGHVYWWQALGSRLYSVREA